MPVHLTWVSFPSEEHDRHSDAHTELHTALLYRTAQGGQRVLLHSIILALARHVCTVEVFLHLPLTPASSCCSHLLLSQVVVVLF